MAGDMPADGGGRLQETAVREFRTKLRGRLISPGDPEYDAARRVHNGMIDKYPRLIARCRDVADVIASIDFGRDHGVTVAVRSGGHSAAGFGTVDDGRADFIKDLSDEAITRHVEHGSKLPTLLSTMHIYPMDGAVRRVGRNDTAFNYRDTNWAEVIVGFDMDPVNADLIKNWTIAYWDALHPLSEAGAYVN